jgi:predicted HicB family RNase H-like nuclease
MPKETMKQVAVRMTPKMHKELLDRAKKEDISFGELVRRAAATLVGK